MRVACVVAVLAGGLLLSGCQTTHVAPVLQKQSAAKFGEELAPIKFDRVGSNLSRGLQIGSYRNTSGCGVADPIYWMTGKAKIHDEEFTDSFFQELKRANYNVIGDPKEMFGDYTSEKLDPEYLIGGRIDAITMDICEEYDGWSGRYTGRESGSAAIDVTWQVFSTLERKVVYETKTRGSSNIKAAVPDGEYAVLESAFAAAASNLAGEQAFHDLLAGGQSQKSTVAEALVSAPELAIPRVAPYSGGIASNVARIERSVVTVVVAGGHGSGFFIAPKLVLTNHHVAGGSKRVKLQFVDGKEIYATVLRTQPGRDVALLEVEEGSYDALPVSDARVGITEEVYAVGSPLEQEFVGTVTRGIVSQVKPDDRGLEFIQADANIQHGNSGGPLLDKDGNVVGISVAGIMDQADSSVGINFFIPINDALKKLNIVMR